MANFGLIYAIGIPVIAAVLTLMFLKYFVFDGEKN